LPWASRLKGFIGRIAGRVELLSRHASDSIDVAPFQPLKVNKILASLAKHAGEWAKISERDLAALRCTIGDQKVLVFIDDLDRADPLVLPKTLLALRELLDWPGFIFFLAFDEEVVASALEDYASAFGRDGNQFLEKIIDFTFRMPRPSDKAKRHFSQIVFRETCPRLPVEVLDLLLPFLPSEPRRIKFIARSMSVLNKSVSRFGESEIDWNVILLLAILRESSESYTDYLTQKGLNRDYELAVFGKRDQEKIDAGKAIEADVKAEVANISVRSPEVDRLVGAGIRLLDHWRYRSKASIELDTHMLTSEIPITNLEFQQLIDEIDLKNRADLVERTISRAVRAAHCSREDAARELVALAISSYHERVTEVIETFHIEPYEARAAQAKKYLEFVEYIWCACRILEVSNATRAGEMSVRLLGCISNWLGWEKNAPDIELRKRESVLAHHCAVKCAEPSAIVVLARPEFGLKSPVKQRFLDSLMAIVVGRVLDQIIDLYSVNGGFEDIAFGREGMDACTWLLESPNSPVFLDRAHGVRLADAFGQPPSSSLERLIHSKNALLFLEMSVNSARDGSWGGASTLGDKHERIPEIVRCAWQAVAMSPAQFRMVGSIRDVRSKLIANGVPESDVPIPEWLESELSRLELREAEAATEVNAKQF